MRWFIVSSAVRQCGHVFGVSWFTGQYPLPVGGPVNQPYQDSLRERAKGRKMLEGQGNGEEEFTEGQEMGL
jgi:hypothetical protein